MLVLVILGLFCLMEKHGKLEAKLAEMKARMDTAAHRSHIKF
jgi:hypothetical protein